MSEWLHAVVSAPWPWYVSGPLIGLVVPALLVVGNRQFGISSNLRHVCAATLPRNVDFFHYDWRRAGAWNLAFAAGILAGGAIVALLAAGPDVVHISARTQAITIGTVNACLRVRAACALTRACGPSCV